MEPGSLEGSKLWITVATMCAALLSLLDIMIVNVALNDIRASFGTPLDQIAWVSTGYAMANITIIPLSGWMQRRFGYRRYFTASILVFTASSALCGLSWNLVSLVVFRILQGLGGGAIIPTSQSILFARYPQKEHGMAGALFALGAITGPLLGPTLGGYLIEVASWHWIFYVNLPVGLMAAWLAYTHIREPGFVPAKARVDLFGIALLAAGMISLQYVLEEGNRDGWFDSRLIVLLTIVAVVSIVTFVVHELEIPDPVVDFRVFRNRTYAASTGLNFLIGTALFGGSLLYSLYCGAVMHYTALDIGMVFLKGSWIQVLMMPIIGRNMNRLDTRWTVGIGLIGILASLWLNAHLTSQADGRAMVMPIFVRAAALSLCFVPLSVAALSSLSPRQRGNGAGLFNLTRELGGSIGAAWMSTQLDTNFKQNVSDLARHVDIYNPILMEQLSGAQRGPLAGLFNPQSGALGMIQGRITVQALIKAFNQGFYSLAVLFVLAFFLVFLLKKPKPGILPGGAAH
jgi:MFS transporter, DHA2 family, multidrug resistance protein